MAAEAKDVGILAMDIYFPPTCVLQVPTPDSILRSHSPPTAHFPTRNSNPIHQTRARYLVPSPGAHHALRVLPRRLRLRGF